MSFCTLYTIIDKPFYKILKDLLNTGFFSAEQGTPFSSFSTGSFIKNLDYVVVEISIDTLQPFGNPNSMSSHMSIFRYYPNDKYFFW